MGMTVQELIDELMEVEDQSKEVRVSAEGNSEEPDTITEYDDAIVIW